MFYSGKLESQKAFCQELRKHPDFAIDSDKENPMTIRLMATRDAFDGIGKAVRKVNHFAGQMGLQNPPLSSNANLYSWLHKTTPLSGAGFKMPRFRDPNAGKELKIHLAELHKHLYSFYTNGGSCLDRLGWEINRVYGLGLSERAVDFGTVRRTIKKQKGQRPNLYRLLNSQICKDAANFMTYRHHMVHDGIIPLDVRDQVYLPDGFDEQHQPTGFSREPVGLCKQHFAAIEGLVDAAYQMMWEEYQSTGKLPLKGQ